MGMSVKKTRRYGQVKKFIFVLFLIPPALLYISCPEPPPYSIIDDPDIPDVVISYDWKYITIYLDGAHLTAKANKLADSPGADSRNLSPDTARRGFDFFEVAFSSGGVLVRESWEIGRRASVYNVYRTDAGIDYSQVSLGGGINTAAILFAGRKRDKTLLAVGKIVSVDDVPGAIITSDSSFVTFEVFAITGKESYVYNDKDELVRKFTTVSYDPEESCFLTAYGDPASQIVSAENTKMMNMVIGGRAFPLYKLPQGKAAVKAEYKLQLDGVDWAYFAGGILVASVYDMGSTVRGIATIRNPRYPAGNSRYWYPIYPMDVTTEVKMTNNQTVGLPAENTLKFEFDTVKSIYSESGREVGVFTLGFRIPVTQLVKAESPGLVSPSEDEDGGEIAEGVTWFIRPAYQSYYYNIDNGADSTGGGVLMGAFRDHEDELIVNRRSSG
jgi:hypothetical protein